MSSQIPRLTTGTGIDLSFLEAAPVLTHQSRNISLVQVGCGGTGGWLTPAICRIARVLSENGKAVSITLIDPDQVAKANVYRQNFSDAEINLPKATVLALRYGSGWGLPIKAILAPFAPEMIEVRGDCLNVILGCVDNAVARNSIAKVIEANSNHYQSNFLKTWWIDAGNTRDYAQVLVGNTTNIKVLENSFSVPRICSALPSPALQHPELLQPLPEETADNLELAANQAGQLQMLSCEQMALLGTQSLTINQRIAAEAADFLLRLLTGTLRKFATYLNLPTGTAKSYYNTPQAIDTIIRRAL